MMIVRHYVESFAEVVEFFQAWRPFAVPQMAPVPALPSDWESLGWRIEQHGDTACCSIVLKN